MDFRGFIKKIEENNWQVHGVEVYRGHEKVQEYGDTAEGRYPIYSATKTIVSLAVGMAADGGKMDLEHSVLEYLPRKAVSELPEEQEKLFRKVTIKRLLTMSVPGFPFRPEGDSWLYSSLRYPVRPEEVSFDYSNVSAYLTGVAVSNALGEDLYEYLNRKLFWPLGIEKPPCQRCPEGYFYGATGMKLTVNELSRMGFVLMDKGLYQGQRIVSEKYVREAVSIQQRNREGGYGYYIWKYGEGFRISGKQGQRCYIFPERQLLITYLANMEDSEPLAACMREYLLKE